MTIDPFVYSFETAWLGSKTNIVLWRMQNVLKKKKKPKVARQQK